MVGIQGWRGRAMKRPLFLESLSAEETRTFEAGLRSRDAFTLRRAQLLRARARGARPLQIATYLGCNNPTVLHALHAFQTEGVACLRAKSSAPHRVRHAVWSPERDAELRELLHRRPRLFGQPRSPWTLPLRAEVCFEQGMTSREISTEVIRRTLKRLDINWQRAKPWMTSPEPHYEAMARFAIR